MKIIDLYTKSSELFSELKEKYKAEDIFTITKTLCDLSENNLHKEMIEFKR